MRGSIFKITIFIESIANRKKGVTAVAVRKGIPNMRVDLPPLVSVEATRVCIPIGNQEILLAAVYKFPGPTWTDADITELLRFRHKHFGW
jgi:hypothetical protein